MAVNAITEPRRSVRNVPALDVPITLIGKAAEWFSVNRDEEGVLISPNEPLPARCMFRPAALFAQDRGFPDVNTVMGRLLFARGTASPQRYKPYTCDPQRHFRELFLPVEVAPEDDLFSSVTRWRNYETIARRLLTAAGVPWKGLPDADIEGLLESQPWDQPLEGCVLHALVQWTEEIGQCVIEIGSLRGKSLTMLARALRGVRSDSLLISIDPHIDRPDHRTCVRLALEQIGEEDRLVQFPCTSDTAWRLLRPGSASLIFVDGDHSYRQVVADFRNYRDLLAPGGCMVFHDYGYGNHNDKPDVDPEVRPAVDDHVMSDKGFKPLLLAHTLFAFVKL